VGERRFQACEAEPECVRLSKGEEDGVSWPLCVCVCARARVLCCVLMCCYVCAFVCVCWGGGTFPAALHSVLFSSESAGADDENGRDIPRASIADAIVLAVYL
jgi:hypothetical protein